MNTRLGFPSIAVWAAAQADLLEPRYVRPIFSTPRRVDEDPVKRAELRAADNPEPERAAPLKQPEKPAEPAAAIGFKVGDKVRYKSEFLERLPSLAGAYTVSRIRDGGGIEFQQGGWEVPDWLELVPDPDGVFAVGARVRSAVYGDWTIVSLDVPGRWGIAFDAAKFPYYLGESNLELIPAADPDGWVTWGGGECPVPLKAHVEYRMRSGAVDRQQARVLNWTCPGDGSGWNIVAYRVLP